MTTHEIFMERLEAEAKLALKRIRQNGFDTGMSEHHVLGAICFAKSFPSMERLIAAIPGSMDYMPGTIVALGLLTTRVQNKLDLVTLCEMGEPKGFNPIIDTCINSM
jgi:hypothetical protein